MPRKPPLEPPNDPTPPPDDQDAPPPHQLSLIAGGGQSADAFRVVPFLSKSLGGACRILRDPGLREYTIGNASIRFNELTEQIEVADRPMIEADILKWREIVELKVRGTDKNKKAQPLLITTETARDAFDVVAHENSYHPVREYLRGLEWHTEMPSMMDHVSRKAFHQTEDLPIAMLRMFFIGAVARALRPGCKHDHFLVLIGDESMHKSQAVKALCDPWVSDTTLDLSDDKRALSMLNRFWVHEIAELKAFKGKGGHSVKQFLSSPVDNFIPFGGAKGTYKTQLRSCVFLGTTNDRTPLTDPTGNRRTHPIHIPKPIDLAVIRQFRNDLWAEAVYQFDMGTPWWPTSDQSMDLRSEAADLMQTDPWQAPIEAWLRRSPEVVTTHAAMTAIGVPILKQTRSEEMRTAEVLGQLGWVKGNRKRIGGVREYPWTPGKDWRVDEKDE